MPKLKSKLGLVKRVDRKAKIDKMDREISKKIREEQRHCQKCMKSFDPKALQVHHLVGRTNLYLRFDPRNLICLCAECHRYAHAHIAEFKTWARVTTQLEQLETELSILRRKSEI